ncbi:MAG: septum site-determining protein MinC [Wolinella sp.]
MVKARQKTIRIFDFEPTSQEELRVYIEKNAILLRRYLLIFKDKLNSEMRELLHANELNFADSSTILSIEKYSYEAKNPSIQELESQSLAPNTQTKQEQKTQNSPATLVLQRTIRSGEEIVSDGDITLFGRINSGAIVRASGNVTIFGEINGVVECDGEYMILSKIAQGSVLFGGEILDNSKFDGTLKHIHLHNGIVQIKELE